MTLSVLIATYNRHTMLRTALAALIDGTVEKPDQVVIVNGGDSQADSVVAKFSGRHGIQVDLIKTANKNLAASRNLGLGACTGDIVAMTDDDAEVFPDWVTRIKQAHAQHPEAGAIGGRVLGADSGRSFLSRLSDEVTFPSARTPAYVRNIPGVNASYQRLAILQIGSQDEELFRGEDVDFNWRLLRLGLKVYYDPAIQVIHHHRPSVKRFLQQHYMYGRAYYLVRRKWPDMYCVYPHRVRVLRDLAKWVYCLLCIVYQPLLFSAKLERWGDRLLAFPLLIANQLVWKGGMAYEWSRSLRRG